VVLLSAHFQGYCRDLYTEAAMVIASKVRPALRLLIQQQFTAHRKLDRGNPNLQNLMDDFNCIGLNLDLTAEPANQLRLSHLTDLNKWRNVAAHQGKTAPSGIPLNILSLNAWQTSCDGLAVSLDATVYNHLGRLLKRAP
jgi:hypothetical protein